MCFIKINILTQQNFTLTKFFSCEDLLKLFKALINNEKIVINNSYYKADKDTLFLYKSNNFKGPNYAMDKPIAINEIKKKLKKDCFEYQIIELFLNKGIKHETISYKEIYNINNSFQLKKNEIWDKVENARQYIENILNCDVIFESLLAKEDNGLPAIGFFEVLKTKRNLDINNLTLEDKKEIVSQERQKIYNCIQQKNNIVNLII
jgi:hypothetical protein